MKPAKTGRTSGQKPIRLTRLVKKDGYSDTFIAQRGKKPVLISIPTDPSSRDYFGTVEFKAKMFENLRHPNVLHVELLRLPPDLDIVDKDGNKTGETIQQGTSTLVMEYANGVYLSDWKAPRPMATCLTIACGVLSGLQAIHDMGILHRDMKPGNILIDRTEDEKQVTLTPRITNFDIARPKGRWFDATEVSGIRIGTPSYMPPDESYNTVQGDLWGTAVVIYQLIYSKKPYDIDKVTRQVASEQRLDFISPTEALNRWFLSGGHKGISYSAPDSRTAATEGAMVEAVGEVLKGVFTDKPTITSASQFKDALERIRQAIN